MDDTLDLQHGGGAVSFENVGGPEGGGYRKNISTSSSSLSDSGCPKSPDEADFVFSPPTISRCVTDSPSHYFLRGNTHRYASSTPLLKVGGFARSMSIPVSSTPSLPAHHLISPPQASSTPEAPQNHGTEERLEDNSSITEFSSLGSPGNFTPSSLSKIVITPPLTKISSLAQLSSEEFHQRLETLDNSTTDSHTHHFNKAKEAHTCEDNLSAESSCQESIKLGDQSHQSDSGVGSSYRETSTEESPKRDKCQISTASMIPKLRRSPRSLAIQSRLDRCTRLKQASPRSKVKLKTVSSYIIPPGLFLEWEHLDILMHLRTSNMLHIVDTILGFLAPEDLCSVSLVSTSWHSLLKDDLMNMHEDRRKVFVTAKKINQENYGRPVPLTRSSSRIALKEMNKNISPQNKRNRESSSSSSTQNLTSPSKIRSRLFPESIGSVSDKRVDKLLHCPNCSATSTVNSTKDSSGLVYERGECTSKSCSMIFCAKCMFSDHPDKPCQYLQVTRSRSVAISSKKSKARLRRL